MKRITSLLLLLFLYTAIYAESPYPVRGLCIAAPPAELVDEFSTFIKNDLAPAGLNLLILRVDYNYDYKSHPELTDDNPLKEKPPATACAIPGIYE